MTKLTDDNVRTLPAKDEKDTLYPDSDPRNGVSRMYLRVRPGGSRTFVLQWRKDGLQRRITHRQGRPADAGRGPQESPQGAGRHR